MEDAKDQLLVDEARTQAGFRVLYSCIALSYIFVLTWRFGLEFSSPVQFLVVLSVLALFLGLLLYASCTPGRQFSANRQYLIILVDVGIAGYAMYALGEWGSIAYPLMLWIIMGNGMRFGMKYMMFAQLLTMAIFILVLSKNSYWQANMVNGLGLMLGLLVLPMLTSMLVRRLHDARAQLEEELELVSYMANHDPLTDLANRMLFNERLHEEVKRADRNKLVFSVLFLDLDKFKEINDNLGHDTGDRLLVLLAQRFKKVVRETDLAARIGGDEFGFITASGSDNDEASGLKQRLLEAFAQPFVIQDRKISMQASIGVARYPSDGQNVEELLTCSDRAMYLEKMENRYRSIE